MGKGFFITGTDTDVGKTYVSTTLLAAFNQQGLETAAMKPVASGCDNTPEGLRNDDALQLQKLASATIPYAQINPYAFEPAIAPHIAAAESSTVIYINQLVRLYKQIKRQADVTIVEGAGGWHVPLNNQQNIADLASALSLPVILVVAIRLGCINHALLTVESIQSRGVPLAGWVANCIDPSATHIEENIQSLKLRITAPCLGVLPFAPEQSIEKRVQHLDISTLLKSAPTRI
jgi:dethiobiotin synthetase